MKSHASLSVLFCMVLALGACTTKYTRDGQEIPADFAEMTLEDVESVDINKERLEAAVDAVEFERGSVLLQNLQWLIAQKELAVPAITGRLDQSSIRTKANLLYVLGFTRTKESTAALANHMHHKDDIVRYEAAAGLLNHGDTTAVPVLVNFLESPDRRFRFKASEILKARTGRDFGYQFSQSIEARQSAIARWKAWWKREKARLMYRKDDVSANNN